MVTTRSDLASKSKDEKERLEREALQRAQQIQNPSVSVSSLTAVFEGRHSEVQVDPSNASGVPDAIDPVIPNEQEAQGESESSAAAKSQARNRSPSASKGAIAGPFDGEPLDASHSDTSNQELNRLIPLVYLENVALAK